MKNFFRILLISLGGLFIFYFLGTPYHHIRENTILINSQTGQEIEKLTESTKSICVKNPRVEFFMYHYIRDYDIHDNQTTKNLSIPPKIFEEQMQEIRSLADEKKITLMRGEDFLESLKSGCFPGEDIWIFTADDGWIDTRDYLVPLATEYRVPFFLGIITNRLDKKGFLSTSDVETLSKNPLITISSHSVRHTDNSKLSQEEETHEMCDSRSTLEKISGKRIETYIYPSGRINPDIDEAIAKKCGYLLAWSTSFGNSYNSHTGSIYDLNRIRIGAENNPKSFEILSEKNKATK